VSSFQTDNGAPLRPAHGQPMNVSPDAAGRIPREAACSCSRHCKYLEGEASAGGTTTAIDGYAMHTNTNPWRRHTKTEPMTAVEIAEIELEQVTGGSGQSGHAPVSAPLAPLPSHPSWRR
jgi:hypothetical protein